MKIKRGLRIMCESEKDERILRLAYELQDHVPTDKMRELLDYYSISREEFDAFWEPIVEAIDTRNDY